MAEVPPVHSTAPTNRPRTPRLDRWFSRFGAAWKMVGISLALLAVVEMAAQLVFSRRESVELRRLQKRSGLADAPWLADLHREQSEAQVSNWEPFVYWRIRPYAGRLLNVDERGLRRTVGPSAVIKDDSPGALRVFCFGGSAMWGWLARDEHTIPSKLAADWPTNASPRPEITNFAQIGYVTTQETIALHRQLQRQDRPNLVILFDGYNDLLSTIQNVQAGNAQHEPERAAEFHVTSWESLLLAAKRSATGRLAKNVRLALRRGSSAGNRGAGGLTDEDVQRLAEGVVQHYAANLRTIRGMAQEHGFHVLAYWQPMVFTKSPRTDAEQRLVTLKPRLADLDTAVRSRLKQDLAIQEFPVHDLADLFAQSRDEVFLDEVHMTEAGYAACAERILDDIRRWLDSASQHPDSSAP